MTCPACQQHWCWLCGKGFTSVSQHYAADNYLGCPNMHMDTNAANLTREDADRAHRAMEERLAVQRAAALRRHRKMLVVKGVLGVLFSPLLLAIAATYYALAPLACPLAVLWWTNRQWWTSGSLFEETQISLPACDVIGDIFQVHVLRCRPNAILFRRGLKFWFLGLLWLLLAPLTPIILPVAYCVQKYDLADKCKGCGWCLISAFILVPLGLAAFLTILSIYVAVVLAACPLMPFIACCAPDPHPPFGRADDSCGEPDNATQYLQRLENHVKKLCYFLWAPCFEEDFWEGCCGDDD